MLKCIPLNLDWCAPDGREDFHAIYLRRSQDQFGNPILDVQGMEQWSPTGALPMRRHYDWTKKGFRYLTVAIRERDVGWRRTVRPWLMSKGEDPESYLQNPRDRSTFDIDRYLEGAVTKRDQELADLRQLVAKYGRETVEAIKRQSDPGYVLPRLADDDPPVQAPIAPRPAVAQPARAAPFVTPPEANPVFYDHPLASSDPPQAMPQAHKRGWPKGKKRGARTAESNQEGPSL